MALIVAEYADGSVTVYPAAGGGESLAFGPVAGFNYLLVGYHVNRDQLVAAANAVRQSPDGYGAIIDNAGLPAGVSDRGAGVLVELWFVSQQAIEHPSPEAHWTDGSASLWYESFDDPNLPTLGRFGFDSVIDTTINGHPGYIATAHKDALTSVTWTDGKRTFLLASNGIKGEQLKTLAASLRPATDAEWELMKQAGTTAQHTDTTIANAAPTDPPEALLPTWLPEGYVIWNIDVRPTGTSIGIRSLAPDVAKHPADTSWSVVRSNGPLDPSVLNLEQVELNDGLVGFYELNDTSQWLHWQTPDGYDVALTNTGHTMSRDDFEHLARSLQQANTDALDAAQSGLTGLLRTKLVPVRDGDLAGTHIEIRGIDANTPVAVCVSSNSQPVECQTDAGNTPGRIGSNGELDFFTFHRTDGSVDGYGWIKPAIVSFDHGSDLSVDFSTDATGTWVHVTRAPQEGESSLTVNLPDGTNFSMGIS